MFNVIKRDGEVAAFQLSKITQAIEKAFQAQEKQYTPDMIDLLGLRVTADFQNKIENNRISVEDIQDSVENVLIQCRIF
jgi:ribonucleoside-triphosphate reductase